jgi:general secretion pathway protein F
VRTFAYRGYDHQGAARQGLLEAADAKSAREALLARGLLAERVTLAGGAGTGRGSSNAFGLETRIFLYQELGVLLHAGIPLVGALDFLIQSPEFGPAVVGLAAVRDRVREGAALGAALAAGCSDLRPFEAAILEVGEKSGTLDQVLGRLAAFLQEQQRLRERIGSALLYPAIISAFAVVVAVVMLGFVLPAAVRLVSQEARVAVPLLTRAMAGAGRALLVLLPVAALAAAGTVLAARRRARAEAAYRERLDRLAFRLPVWGRGYRLVASLRCARTLALLLRSGVPLVEAVGLAGRATGSPWVARLLAEGAEAVRHGSSLADALRRVPVLAATLPAWVHTGEASGALEPLLETAADTYQQQWDRFVTRALGYLEPALIALVGAFVLLVALSILLPILALNRSLGA